MAFTHIKKRNGQTAEFDRARIEIAIGKANDSVEGEIAKGAITPLVDGIVARLDQEFDDVLPDVESIQDLVEQALMQAGYYRTVRSYILYRERHSQERVEAQEEIIHKLEQKQLTVVQHDGKKEKFSEEKIAQTIQAYTKDLKHVDVPMLVGAVKINLYDGIVADELYDAIIVAVRSFIERDYEYSLLAARLLLNKLYYDIIGPTTLTRFGSTYKDGFANYIQEGVKNKLLLVEMLNFDLEELAGYLKPERDEIYSFMALQSMYGNYFLRPERESKTVLETPQFFWMRVSMGMALNEPVENRTELVKKFYDMVSTKRYTPSSPTLYNSGTSFPQMSSCFLNTVDDDLDHIFKVFRDNAMMSKFSGGIATDWTNIRGTGSLIKTINIPSQGVIPFLKIANDVTIAIARSGRRIGATCVYLENWHYDFEDFLELRKNTGDERRRTHDMNTASWVSDLFMKRVAQDGQWTMFSPSEVPELHDLYGKEFEEKYVEYEKMADNGDIKMFRRTSATQLWRKMLTMLFETGHPWLTFKDVCNLRSPQDHAGVVHNSNLCTEITLNNSADETAVCNLGSVNLATHVKAGKLDTKMLSETVAWAMRMLDNVVDITFYPTEETKTSNMRHRPVGLGIMGFQDALYKLDIPFESEAAIKFADESMELISYHAIMGSANLAREKGAYSSFKGSKWDRGIFPIDTIELVEKERGQKIDVSRTGKLNWKPVREAVKKYGLRNSNTMAIAPTASIANINDCYPCIEPIYKNLYVKSNMNGEFTVINPFLVEDLKKAKLWNDDMIEKLKFHDGSIQKITEIPQKLRDKYKEVFETDSKWLVRVAAYRGKWIDQSQSFNVFVRGVSGKALSEIYTYAWKMGLKTTYYLRSLAASQVEKSTVDTGKFGSTHKRDFSAIAVETVETAPVPAPIAENAPVPKQQSSKSKK
ncbi:ribonucleoside-diphosphate reductase subunit alpha [Candidatus Saccharibacteria bacterium]|nr:ribonucleoside-diphosphate reductase subunit alpha [Candidatus Saccharibacteria bacterium]